MTGLKTLIDNLEQAKIVTRELDAQIMDFHDKTRFNLEGVAVLSKTDKKLVAPFYTSSLDAALTLVPEGWGWAVAELDEGTPSAVTTNREPLITDGTLVRNPKKIDFRTKAVTPALALCIAALKARLHKRKEEGTPVD